MMPPTRSITQLEEEESTLTVMAGLQEVSTQREELAMIKHWKKLLFPLLVGAIIYSLAGGPPDYFPIRGIVVEKTAAEEELIGNISRFSGLANVLTLNLGRRFQSVRPFEKNLPTKRNAIKIAIAKPNEAKKEHNSDVARISGFYAYPGDGLAANSQNKFLIACSDESALIDSLIAALKHDPKANSQRLKLLEEQLVFAAETFRPIRMRIALDMLLAFFGSVALFVALLFMLRRP